MTPIRDASFIQQIDKLTRDMESRVRRQFLAAIQDIKDRATLRAIRDALARRDIKGAIRAVGVESAAFRAYQASLTEAYAAAGVLQSQSVIWRDPNFSKITVRFDMDNPGARAWLTELSSTRVTNIVQDQITAIRQTIEAGYARGRGPQDIARDIIGRVGTNGKRVGGIVGLSEPQVQWVRNMRQYLETDPARALRMTRRDRTFDRTIARALREDTPIAKPQIDRMVSAYERRLLARRGEDIARTETSQAVSSARMEAMRQGVDKSGISPDLVVKKWFHSGPAAGGNERMDHAAMNRAEVFGMDTPFIVGGTPMQHPHDPNAPAEHVVNCRCGWTTSVDYARLAV